MKKLSWIIQLGPQCHHEYPCKREAKGDTHKDEKVM